MLLSAACGVALARCSRPPGGAGVLRRAKSLRLEWRRSCIAAQRSAARSQTRSMRWRVCPPARRVASPAHSYTSAQVTQGMISPAVAMKVLEQVR